MVYVLPKYRRKGIGTKLIRNMKNFILSDETIEDLPWVFPHNEETCLFFNKVRGKDYNKFFRIHDL